MAIHRTRFVAAVAVALTLASACSDSTTVGSGTGGTTTSVAASTSSTDATSTTSSTPASTTVAPTIAPSSTAPVTAAPTTAGGGGTCPGSEGIAPGADIGTVLHGDIDGDLADDTVTEYSLDGVPHVHAFLATGEHSDAVVQIGFADHVQISFEDFDYSLGAPTPPPVAVLAIGATRAGTAVYTFLTLTTEYCIRPWHAGGGGAMFVGRIAADGPYEGLSCETAAGNRYYAMNEATQAAPGGDWTVHQTLINHNFTQVELTDLGTITVPDSPDIQDLYGDFSGCDHAPMF